MNIAVIDLSQDIPGVFQATQKRSIVIRDGFINAGVDALNEMRFGDLKVSNLAADSGNSVGSFYTRFKDKDAFFRALRVYAVEALDAEISERFTAEILKGLPPDRGLELLVEVLGDVFCSRFRGVLRESLLRILEPDDPWAPMRQSAQTIIGVLHHGLEDAFPHFGTDATRTRLSFCFQMVVGVLQNELVNDYHVFSTRDRSIRFGLTEALCSYMANDRKNFTNGK